MYDFDEIRKRFPSAQGLSENQIVERLAQRSGLPYEQVAAQFGITKDTSSGFFGGAQDVVIEAANAAAGLVGSASEFVSPGNRLSRGIRENIIEPGEARQTVPTQLAKRNLARGLESSELGPQARAVYEYVTENPLLAFGQAAGGFAPVGLPIRGAQAAATGLGLGAAGARRAGLTTGSAISGAAAGGEAGGSAYELVMNTPREVLLAHPQAQELINSGVTDEAAIYEELATRAARRASIVPAAVGAVAGTVGAESALVSPVRGIRGVGRKVGGEFVTEAGEEGTTTYSGRAAAQEYNPAIDPMAGVAGSALLGGVMGAGVAAPIALARMERTAQEGTDLTQPDTAPAQGTPAAQAPATEEAPTSPILSAARTLAEFDPYAEIEARAAAGRPMSEAEATQFLSSTLAAQRAGQQFMDLMQQQQEAAGRIGQVGEQYQRMVGQRGDQILRAQEAGELARPIVSGLEQDLTAQEAPFIAAQQAGAGTQQLPGMVAGAGTVADYRRIMDPNVMQPVETQEFQPIERTALLPQQPAPFSNIRMDRPGPAPTPAPSSLLSERPAEPVTPLGAPTAVAAALPAAQPAAGVSSTGAPSGTKAPKTVKAKTQRAKAPAAPAAAVVEDTAPKNVSEAIKEDNEIDRVLKAVEAEDDKADKLFASVTGDTKKAPGKPSMPAQVYAAIRNAILNPGKAVVVRKAKSVEKDAAATEKYGAKAKRIAEAANEFAAAYETYASQNLVRSGEVVKRGQTADDVVAGRAAQLKANAAAVQQALAKLGEAVEGNAKDVEAVVRFVKDRAQKEKKGDVKTVQADITLSRAWTAAKSESFMGEPDLLATTGAEVRQSREATARGVTPQLVDAATEGYKIMGKGEAQKGLNGILNYIRTVGTPFEKTLAQAIKLAVAGKAPINIKFVKEGTSQYDPKTNTITINETSSKEVALHEALHGALQWFVYTNPNAAQVVALKTALQRVVNYNGTLPPKAAEVQALLKKILAGKSKTAELDAVLELVSYGNTLNDFRRALQGMESDAPRTFTKFANDVMDAIYALVRRMLGSSQTVASDVMENTFQLLEAARAATQETAPKKGNVLQAAIDTTTDAFKRWFGDSKVTEKGGKAKVVYTGTSKDKDFTTFKVPRNGVWFTEDAASASSYAVENDSIGFKWEGGRPVEINTASRVIPAFLRVENPYTMTPADMARINKENYKKAQGDFFDTLRAQGYDGVDMGDGIWVVIKEPAQIKSSIGNRGTFDPTSGNILKAEVTSLDAAAKEVGYADASQFAKGPGAFKTPTQVVFELVGLGRVNGKDLKLTRSIKESGGEFAEWIRKNAPTVERTILNFNSRFSNGPLMNSLIDVFKFDQNTGYLQMEKISQHLTAHPELAKPFLDFMDGNTKALDGVRNAEGMKAIATNLRGLMDKYINSLPANSPERRTFERVPFSQYLLHPNSIGQVAGSKFGVKTLAGLLGTETRREASIDEFKNLLATRSDGSVDLDDPLYQLFEDKLGQVLPAGFISKAKYEADGNNPAGMKVATDRIWKFSQFKDGDYKFSSSMTAKQATDSLKTEELSAALLNTTAALAHTYASRNFLTGLNKLGRQDGKASAQTIAFNDVEEVNSVFTDRKISDNMVLKVSDESSKAQDVRLQTQRTGTWVQLPASENYGELAGKIVPGPVWNAMLDMHDRSPLINVRAFNSTMAFFKKAKTVYNPGTHVTNILSNVTLATMHGLTFRTMGRAAKMFVQFDTNPGAMSASDRALVQAFYDSGAVLGQFSSTEVKQTVYDKLSQAITPDSDSSYLTKLKTFANYEKNKARLARVDNLASDVYAAEDNVFRLAAFLNVAGNLQVREGTKTLTQAQMEEAGLAARKMFLDYDIDARVIRAMRQSFLPFISWSYAIMPVLGRMAIEKPWAMANVLMAYALMSAAMEGDDEEEMRKAAPDYLRNRAWGGLGPYMHLRVPFIGDDENPVYFNLGKYIPMFTLFQPPPGEAKLAGQEYIPGFATPSGPFVTLVSAMFGYDPFTGKPMHDPTDTQWDKLVRTGKAAYDTMAPAAVNSKFWDNIGKLKNDVTGPTGVETSALFLARNLGGLGLYQFNVDESRFYQDNEVKKIERAFSTAMNKAKRLEMSKGYPDYEALDAELDTLAKRLEQRIAEIRGEKPPEE